MLYSEKLLSIIIGLIIAIGSLILLAIVAFLILGIIVFIIFKKEHIDVDGFGFDALPDNSDNDEQDEHKE